MTAEVFEYVRIGMNQDGYALVEVCMKDQHEAVGMFFKTIMDLQDNQSINIKIANPQNRIEVTNANKDRVPMVTVKGDELLMPTERFQEEKKKVASE